MAIALKFMDCWLPTYEPLTAAAGGTAPRITARRGGWLEANADAVTLVDKGALSGNSADDILGVNVGAIPPP